MDEEPFGIDDVVCIVETDDAVKVESPFFDEDGWIPKRGIHDESDIQGLDDEGTLLVEAWLARDRGWLEE